MTEEIRYVIDAYANDDCLYPDRNCELCISGYCISEEEAYKCLLKRLAELGIVLRVKCPDCEWSQFVGVEWVGMTPCHSCNSTGYLIEPLIEEGK